MGTVVAESSAGQGNVTRALAELSPIFDDTMVPAQIHGAIVGVYQLPWAVQCRANSSPTGCSTCAGMISAKEVMTEAHSSNKLARKA
jgi:hypothetical protein